MHGPCVHACLRMALAAPHVWRHRHGLRRASTEEERGPRTPPRTPPRTLLIMMIESPQSMLHGPARGHCHAIASLLACTTHQHHVT